MNLLNHYCFSIFRNKQAVHVNVIVFCLIAGVFRLLLQSRFHFLPRMGVEEEALPHGFRHALKPAHRNSETQFVSSYVWANGWVEQPHETSLPLTGILHDGHRNDRATTRTELCDDGIRGICVEESPAT